MAEKKKRIMVVDDEKNLRDLFTTVLKKEGYDVVAADSPEEALPIIAEEENFDLILTDMTMPGMSGMEFLKALRRDGRKMPVIGMTGKAKGILLDVIKEVGFEGLLFKPFSTEDLLTTVRSSLLSPTKTTN